MSSGGGFVRTESVRFSITETRLVAADTIRGAKARVAQLYGVSPTMVGYIVKRKKWKHLVWQTRSFSS